MGSSAFARHYLRNHFCFLLLGVLRCFSSPRSPHPLGMVPAPLLVGFPIRKSPDQVVFADPRGLSQLITSFLASMSQGIHPSPFSRFLYSWRPFGHRDSFLVFFVFPTCQRSSPLCGPVENKGLEPLTPCVQGRCSKPTELIPPSGLTLFFFLRRSSAAVFHNFREEPSQETPASRSPERRCSSRTFRYGYLVTT